MSTKLAQKFRKAVKTIQLNNFSEVRLVKDGEYLKLHDDDDDVFVFTALTREIKFNKDENTFRWKLLQPSDVEFWDFMKILQLLTEDDKVSLELTFLDKGGETVGKVSHERITLDRFELSDVSSEGTEICFIDLIIKYKFKRVV